MSSHAHVQLWRTTPHHQGNEESFLSYMRGFTQREHSQRSHNKTRKKNKREYQTSPENLERIAKAVQILKEEGPMKQSELCARIGWDGKKFNKAIADTEHLYLFWEDLVEGREILVGLHKEVKP